MKFGAALVVLTSTCGALTPQEMALELCHVDNESLELPPQAVLACYEHAYMETAKAQLDDYASKLSNDRHIHLWAQLANVTLSAVDRMFGLPFTPQ